ncbi:MAG: response regulator [Hyphomicrobiaceae bacterium]|nr:response regulator [Hyphomicrobiaceae bacterium]
MSASYVPHAAFGCTMSDLDVVVVEDSKPMQLILRSMFNAAKIARLRVYDNAGSALEAMLTEPPKMLITDWNMSPINGYQLIKTLRSPRMRPLCFVPIIVITAHATHRAIDKLVRAGAHHVVVKPFSPTQLLDRVAAICEDSRPMAVDHDAGTVQIPDILRALDSQAPRWKAVEAAREFHKSLSDRPRPRPPEEVAAATAAPPPKPAAPAKPVPAPAELQAAMLSRHQAELDKIRKSLAESKAKPPEPHGNAGGMWSRRKEVTVLD